MTREEVIKRLKLMKKEWDRHIYDLGNSVALSIAIKALEQEPVLDKIRTEIKKETDKDDHADEYYDGYYDGMRKALAIIDKYKSGNERK